jgi:hypothetical protein
MVHLLEGKTGTHQALAGMDDIPTGLKKKNSRLAA